MCRAGADMRAAARGAESGIYNAGDTGAIRAEYASENSGGNRDIYHTKKHRISGKYLPNTQYINTMLYQLSYRGVDFILPTKKRAKGLLFFDMTKYFRKKMIKKCIFVIWGRHFDIIRGNLLGESFGGIFFESNKDRE